MTEPTSDAEDFADYIDDHQKKAPPDRAEVDRAPTPDVDEGQQSEPPD